MIKLNYFQSAKIIAGLLATAASSAHAQAVREVEEVVVTGSLLQGTPTNTAIPVAVVTAEDLERKGSPTVVEMIKALTVSNGVIGESNQFTAGRGQGAEGTSTVNLRGLGPERTLLLFNGQRLSARDLNVLPLGAIGRVEVLKDGGAATYGSDAIGGVVNFITRSNVRGLELSADYRFVTGSNGQYNVAALYGWGNDSGLSGLLSGGYQYKSELSVRDRDWAHRSFEENPQGGWAGATNPGRFTPVSATYQPVGAAFTDVGCVPLGGIVVGDGLCRNQTTVWTNIVNRETRYQAFGEVRYDVSDRLTLKMQALYASTDVPRATSAASFATSRPITETVLPSDFTTRAPAAFITAAPDVPNASNFFYVPRSNPGVAAYCAANPTQCGTAAGVVIQIAQWKPFGLGGNPILGDGSSYGSRKRETAWVSAGAKGELGEFALLGAVNFDAHLTYSRYETRTNGFDALTGRLELALRGLGGPGCNPATGTPGVGPCAYFNPFSNATAGNPLSGAMNPGYNAATANTNIDLLKWFFVESGETRNTSETWEGNLVFSGRSSIELPGGAVGWAAGAQWRQNNQVTAYDGLSSSVTTPCADTPINGSRACSPSPSSPFTFFGTAAPTNYTQNIYAAFAELGLPITDDLEMQLSARYEDYGRYGGSTFNPQARAKWQIIPALALRGSVGTTFRAPPLSSLAQNTITALSGVYGNSRPVETSGNPNLEPEKAFTYSYGAILDVGSFRATADFWSYKLEDILVAEPLQAVVTAAFPTASSVANCNDPFVASHFTFSSLVCNATSIASVQLRQINGPTTRTSGVDLQATYDIRDVADGNLQLGGSLTYVRKYSVDALVINGVTFSPAVKAVGYANFGNSLAYPLPEWKAEVYAEYTRGDHNLRGTLRYIAAYVDQRPDIFIPSATTTQVSPTPVLGTLPLTTAGRKIDAQAQFDLAYRLRLSGETTFMLAIQNVFDKDPPFSRTELSYDPLTGNPLGRTFQVGLRKRF